MLSLHALRECFEGGVPSAVATCASDGTPNVTFVSHIQLVDADHVALSFQFFNKTRANVLENGRASALVVDPETAGQYRLDLEYVRTETSGPLFELMKARLAGIASHTGMAGVFVLRGSDLYRVHRIEAVPDNPAPAVTPQPNLLPALRSCTARLAAVAGKGDLAALLDETLGGLRRHLGIDHAMILMLDGTARKLYTVASAGYERSGVGSEIPLGCGVVGVAAEQVAPIRIGYMTADYAYGRAIRDSLVREGQGDGLETAIPFPGLASPGSQIAVPIVAAGCLLGVLYAEDERSLRFGYDMEDALASLAAHLGSAMAATAPAGQDHGESTSRSEDPAARQAETVPAGPASRVRHYLEDDSVFIDDDYLIKGVAGAVLAWLLRDHLATGRVDFTNRELRLDPALRLPDVTDNLEARLILLQRRLVERRAPIRIEKTGRGRFRLRLERPVAMVEVGERLDR